MKILFRDLYAKVGRENIFKLTIEDESLQKDSNDNGVLLIMALQLFMPSFGLLIQFLPSSSILDKGLPIWHF